MLKWPQGALRAFPAFFTKWNDIDVYIEDTAARSRSFYVALINRALSGKAKASDIFSLGCKKAVVETCKSDQGKGGRPRIYLIDGDLDISAGTPLPRLRHLYRHNVYAIENYLVCGQGFGDIVHEENPSFTRAQVEIDLDFKGLIVALVPLNQLFIVFAISYLQSPELPTVSLGLGPFLDGKKPPWLDSNKIADFDKTRRVELLRKSTKEELAATEKKILANIAALQHSLDNIAAREFLIPLMRFWAGHKGFSLRVSTDAFYMRLGKSVSLDRHTGFVSTLMACAAKK